MGSQFVAVPLKRTHEVDLARPLKSFIASTYSSSETAVDETPCDEFAKLRTKAVCTPLDKHESSLQVLARYYDQLVAVEGKLPMTATSIPVPFKWKDAFDKGSLFWGKASLTLPSGSFERAAVLFNLGALQSQIAAAQSLSSEDELKLAAKMLQSAAGIFHQLAETVMSLVQADPTPDLHPDTLGALSALMLAQAQEAIYLKAARDMKPAICAKIAAQAGELYAEAGRQLNKEPIKALFEKEWMGQVKGKEGAFLALAQYQQSRVAKDAKIIGEELARLQEADKRITAARTLFGSHSDIFATEGAAIAKAHQLAKKDNDFIYHERIPDFKSLDSIGKAAVAKSLPVPKPMSANFKDLFEGLVPVAVHQALAAYDVRKTEIVNGETARLREATQMMNATLTSLNLPAALDDALGGVAVPESVAAKASRVASAGGIDSLQRMRGELPTLYNRNSEILEETTRLLQEEKQSDEQLRAQYKEKWTRMASDALTKPLWEELGKFRSVLGVAKDADSKVAAKFDSHKRGMEILSGGQSALTAAIPSAAGSAVSNSPVVRQLQELMSQVEVLKAKREQLEVDLKGASFDMAPVFLRALAESGSVDEEGLSLEKLNETYGPLREAISASVNEQDTLMSSVQAANAQFDAEKSGGGAERETALKMLAAAHDAFMELRSNLQEGTKFYNDLTPLLVRLQQKVSDFTFARKTEKDDLLKDLQGGSGGGGAAPPRPPPPRAALPPPTATSAPSPYPAANNPFTYTAAAPTYSAPPQPAAVPPPSYVQQSYAPPTGAPPQPGAPAAPVYNPYAQQPPYPNPPNPAAPNAPAQNPYAPQQPYPYGQPPQAPYPYPPQQAPYPGGYPAPPPQAPYPGAPNAPYPAPPAPAQPQWPPTSQ